MTPQQSSAGQSGITLLELLVVLSLVSLMAAFSVTLFSAGGERAKLKSCASEISSSLQIARSTAIADNRQVSLPFWSRQKEAQNGPGLALGCVEDEVQIFLSGLSANQDSLSVIAFYPDGSASGGIITLRAGERAASFRIGVHGTIEQVNGSPIP